MPWPTDAAVERAQSVVTVGWTPRAMLEAAGLPELFGLTDAAECYGVAKQNVTAIAGLPAHVYGPDLPPPYRLRWGRFWLADEIRAHAAERDAAKAPTAPIDLPCFRCSARAGAPCRTSSGNTLSGFHLDRTRAARRANGETA